MASFDPKSLIGHTYLKMPETNGNHYRAKIVEAIKDNQHEIAKNPQMCKFHCSVNNGEYEEIMVYGQLCKLLEDHEMFDADGKKLWKFKAIIGHQGPLR